MEFSVVAQDTAADSLSYVWNMGDGTTYTDASITHTYTVAGTHTITLTVFDDDTSTEISRQVTAVSLNTGKPFVVLAAPDDIVHGEPAAFQFTVTDQDAADQNGNFTYVVDWGDGNVDTIVGPATQTLTYT